ncbi:MAG: hydroxyisourate hydrolase [Acidobacteriaceae bacterium]|nr:hydroxyisourate hydrolase [Acidobacteriaceae bacterium]
MSGISTHLLDTAAGRPACGVAVRLFHYDEEIAHGTTDDDGRCPALLPNDAVLHPGIYRIVFDVAGKFPDGFYPEITVSFRVDDTSAHYHVPLLVSPFGYTTYRGS